MVRFEDFRELVIEIYEDMNEGVLIGVDTPSNEEILSLFVGTQAFMIILEEKLEIEPPVDPWDEMLRRDFK